MEYAERGISEPIDAYVSKEREFRLADWPARAQEALKVVDGRIYGLPHRGQVSGYFLYWNRDLLRQSGLAEPTAAWTMDDLIAAGKRLVGTGPGDFYPIHVNWSGFRKDVYCSPELLDDTRFAKPALQANCDSVDAPEGYTYPYNFRFSGGAGLQDVLNATINGIADLTVEPTPGALRELASELQKVLDQPRLGT
jgi:ABC-type glycerol-3-phosphate transport system substrate-binding protein